MGWGDDEVVEFVARYGRRVNRFSRVRDELRLGSRYSLASGLSRELNSIDGFAKYADGWTDPVRSLPQRSENPSVLRGELLGGHRVYCRGCHACNFSYMIGKHGLLQMRTRQILDEEAAQILSLSEGYFLDFKSRNISPSKLSKTISAFANASGGEVFIGVEDELDLDGTLRVWDGFENEESANAVFQQILEIDPLNGWISCEFLRAPGYSGLLLQITVSKAQGLVTASDQKAYLRRNAASFPVNGEALERLKYSKGIMSYEDEKTHSMLEDVTNSETVISFMLAIVPTGEPEHWLNKQFLIADSQPTVASVLLFADEPQAALPKRSSVKILRYKTTADAERDFLTGQPETIEGPIYHLIYNSIARVKEIIEEIERLGPNGLERIEYPHEALHELLTNAILHRDYSIPADIQVRIFDNRVEIESPGKLPGHVTVNNIGRTQFARNQKIVRIINKFTDPPNKDVGEGINTAFEAMEKLRLKKPELNEADNSLIVTLKHESLGSPEQIVLQYLESNSQITNQIARDLTGIKSENTMKNVFYRLRDVGQLEQVPKELGRKRAWRRPATS